LARDADARRIDGVAQALLDGVLGVDLGLKLIVDDRAHQPREWPPLRRPREQCDLRHLEVELRDLVARARPVDRHEHFVAIGLRVEHLVLAILDIPLPLGDLRRTPLLAGVDLRLQRLRDGLCNGHR
jgi:hypothetical protein